MHAAVGGSCHSGNGSDCSRARKLAVACMQQQLPVPAPSPSHRQPAAGHAPAEQQAPLSKHTGCHATSAATIGQTHSSSCNLARSTWMTRLLHLDDSPTPSGPLTRALQGAHRQLPGDCRLHGRGQRHLCRQARRLQDVRSPPVEEVRLFCCGVHAPGFPSRSLPPSSWQAAAGCVDHADIGCGLGRSVRSTTPPPHVCPVDHTAAQRQLMQSSLWGPLPRRAAPAGWPHLAWLRRHHGALHSSCAAGVHCARPYHSFAAWQLHLPSTGICVNLFYMPLLPPTSACLYPACCQQGMPFPFPVWVWRGAAMSGC